MKRSAIIVAVAACTVGPAYRVPSSPQPSVGAYREAGRAGAWRVARPSDAMLRGAWWQIFHEPELDRLEAKLAVDNQTIAQAFDNYLAARAQVHAAHAQYFPTIATAPSASYARASSNGGGGGGAMGSGFAATARATQFSLPVEASWAPDLWGRIRNAVKQAKANAQVSAADLESQRLLEQATLAQTYFELRGQDALQDVLDQTVVADRAVAEVARSRFDTGVDTEVAAVQAEQTLQAAIVAATNVGLLRAQDEHAIATLIGVPATALAIPPRGLLVSPPPVPIGAPSQLLERRPDVASAERKMAAANAQIGIGYAAYYPDLNLSGMVGLASSTLGSLVSWPSRVWSVGGTLSETLFDGGLRRAQLDQDIAQYNAAVAGYRETVLIAFQQVEDGLSATTVLADEVVAERKNVELAEHAYELERVRFDQGIDPYINLMQEQIVLLAARQSLVQLQVQEMTSAISLIEALGGGWDVKDLPSDKQIGASFPKEARKIAR